MPRARVRRRPGVRRTLPAWLLCLCAILPGMVLGQGSVPPDDPVVARYTVRVLPPERADDGYWDWFVGHVLARKAYDAALVETRVQLAWMASEISRARAMRFNLSRMRMEWLAAAGEEVEVEGLAGLLSSDSVVATARVGPRAREANQRHSRDLGERIRALRQQQEDLVQRLGGQLDALLSAARAQVAESGDQRPLAMAELARLEEEQAVLPLFLHDYAAWYAPDELPRLISDFRLRETLDPGIENLLLAKAKVADAEDLERRAFIERLRPVPDNYQRLLFTLATIQGDPLGYLGGRTQVDEILRQVTTADVLQTTAQTQRLDAIALLREVLHADPDDAAARALLLGQEQYWLKRIAQKLERQADMAQGAFAAYLSTRGFDPADRAGWWPWMKDYLGAVWGLGPIALFAGIPGIDLPAANAELVGAQLMDAARSRVALVAVLKLSRAGRTLAELKAMDAAALAASLRELWGEGAAREARAVTRFAVDVHTTLRTLRDLDRLSTDDGDTLEFARDVNQLFASDYYLPVDSRYQSFEWFGDLLNVHNIVTLWGPGAITRVDGRWVKSGYMSFAEQDRLQRAGTSLAGLTRSAASRILDSQSVAIAGYNLDTIGETIRRSRSVRLMARAHAAATAPVIRGSALTRLLGESATLVAGMALNTALTEGVKASGIPGAALLTEIVLSYEVPGGLLNYLVHEAPAVPLTRLAGTLRQYRDDLAATGRQLDATRSRVDESGELLARLDTVDAAAPAGGRVDEAAATLAASVQNEQAARLRTVAASLADEPLETVAASATDAFASRITVDGVPRSETLAAEEAVFGALTAIADDDAGEARRALAAANTLVDGADDDLRTALNRVDEAVDRLSSATAGNTVRATAEPVDLSTRPIGQRDGNIEALIDEADYAKGVAGDKLRVADETGVRGDDLDAALAHLEEARRHADAFDDVDDALRERLYQRQRLLANARDARGVLLQRRAESHDFPALAEITDDDLAQILDRLRAGDFDAAASGLNPAISVTVNGRTFRLKPKQPEAQAEVEAVGGVVARLLGLDTPSATLLDGSGVRIQLDGQPVDLGRMVVTRQVDDFVPLRDLDEATLLALRGDYADQRVLRALLADSDGHLGNIGLGPNGKLWVIDTDLANLDAVPVLRQARAEFSSQAELVEAAVAFAHGRAPEGATVRADTASFLQQVAQHPLYRWIARADQMIGYRDMEKMVTRIHELLAVPDTLLQALQNNGVDPARAREIHDILRQRADALEAVLGKPSLFGGGAVELGQRRRPRDERFAAFCLAGEFRHAA